MTIYYKGVIKKLDRGKINLGLIIIFAIFLLAMIYLFQTNAIITSNYQLMEYKKTLQQIQTENQKLRVEAVQMQSLPYLEKAIKNLNMVITDRVEYLYDPGVQIAKK